MSKSYHENGKLSYDSSSGKYFHKNGNIAYDPHTKKICYENGNLGFDPHNKKVYYDNTYLLVDPSYRKIFHKNGNLAWDPLYKVVYHSNGNIQREKAESLELNLGSGILFKMWNNGYSYSLSIFGNELSIVNLKNESSSASSVTEKQSVPVKLKNCDYCGEKFSTGFSAKLRLDKDVKGYKYCSKNCAEIHYKSDNYVKVGNHGMTAKEWAKYTEEFEKKKKAETKVEKKLDTAKSKKNAEGNEDKKFIKNYGPTLVFVLAATINYFLLTDSDKSDLMTMLLISNVFFALAFIYCLFPDKIDSLFK